MNVGIVEDQILYQRYLSELISKEFSYEVALCTGDAQEALGNCSKVGVELLILDLKVHGLHGTELAESLIIQNPSLKILAYSVEVNVYNLRMLDSLGVLGYLDKSDPVMQSDSFMIQAIQSVVRGKRVYTPGVESLLSGFLKNNGAFHKILTPRKIQILKYIGRCMNDDEIGKLLDLSSHTVRKHRTEMIQQLNLDSTFELIRYAQKNGFSNEAERA